MIRRIALTTIVLLLTASLVSAQEPGLYLGPQAGLFSNDDAEDDFNFMIGAMVRARLGQMLGVEGSVNYRQEDFANDDLTVRTWPVMVTGLLYVMPALYGAVGVGWYNTTFDWDSEFENEFDLGDETSNEFGWHFGGGVELPVSDQVSLMGDVRYVFLDYDFETAPVIGDVDADFYAIMFGLLFSLR